MWNRTGLPAVFPLQVKTKVGADYYLVLVDKSTGDPALAAYIRGGRFFRVLVPPGTYWLQFSYGTGWQGEEDLFGPGDATRAIRLPRPLTFETRGLRAKAGHLVDLTTVDTGLDREAGITPNILCQTIRAAQMPPPARLSRDVFNTRWTRENWRRFAGLDTRDSYRFSTDAGPSDERVRRDLERAVAYLRYRNGGRVFDNDVPLGLPVSRYHVRSRYCQ